MIADQPMIELTRLGIRVESHGDRLRYSPRSEVAPELLRQLKLHKEELLQILKSSAVTDADDSPWLEKTDGEGRLWLVNPPHLDSFRLEILEPPAPCPDCGTLELWQTLAGNWRCLHCDPPSTARRLRERGARLRPERTGDDGER